MKLSENAGLKNAILMLLCATIIATGFIISAAIFANTVTTIPMQGSFNGSISSGSYTYPEIMEIDGLMGYLGIYPGQEFQYWDEGTQQSSYDKEKTRLQAQLQDNITSGRWVGFPYVLLDGKFYFSKQAVDDWFAERGKEQLVVPR